MEPLSSRSGPHQQFVLDQPTHVRVCARLMRFCDCSNKSIIVIPSAARVTGPWLDIFLPYVQARKPRDSSYLPHVGSSSHVRQVSHADEFSSYGPS
jgi:hypothetical protein